ncbi:hypothetical protein [Lysinibacillus sp. OF-1]|uniref:hypothetical protein n=1 Tax=Lysinibacillus sp. OF-1 TaxID=2972483 RepID=UPI00232C01F3|nr:hypothetical protein [Lysinibacillus sp. OF-1]WCH49679.1 hypothetical protein NV349_09965 [Lysinibacillus sp. OF-1]
MAISFIVGEIDILCALLFLLILSLFHEYILREAKRYFENYRMKNKRCIIVTGTLMITVGVTFTINRIFLKIMYFYYKYDFFYKIGIKLKNALSDSGITINNDIEYITLIIITLFLTFFGSLLILKYLSKFLNSKISSYKFFYLFVESNQKTKDIFSVIILWLTLVPTFLGVFFVKSIDEEALMPLIWFILTISIAYSMIFLDIYTYKESSISNLKDNER